MPKDSFELQEILLIIGALVAFMLFVGTIIFFTTATEFTKRIRTRLKDGTSRPFPTNPEQFYDMNCAPYFSLDKMQDPNQIINCRSYINALKTVP
jgi:hypothetical protein